jgi:hypothetical protein
MRQLEGFERASVSDERRFSFKNSSETGVNRSVFAGTALVHFDCSGGDV